MLPEMSQNTKHTAADRARGASKGLARGGASHETLACAAGSIVSASLNLRICASRRRLALSLEIFAHLRRQKPALDLGQIGDRGQTALIARGQIGGRVDKEHAPPFDATKPAALAAHRL